MDIDKMRNDLGRKMKQIADARQSLMNVNEDYESFKLGIYLNITTPHPYLSRTRSQLVNKLATWADIVIDGVDDVEKHRYGANGIIGERNHRCIDKNCGMCRACIQEMKTRLSAYEAKYGKLDNSVDDVPKLLDDSFTPKG